MIADYTTTGIAFTQGLLSVTDHQGNETIISELPMSKYELFYKYWSLAFAQAATNPDHSFQELWVFNQVFRNNLERALELLGINAGDYSPRVIKELLMVAGNGGPGLIFQLHQEDQPNPKKLPTLKEPETPTAPKTAWSFQKAWTGLIKHVSFVLNYLVIQSWQVVGL